MRGESMEMISPLREACNLTDGFRVSFDFFSCAFFFVFIGSHVPGGLDWSLKVGRGAMAASRKLPLGCSPSGPSCMHIVPPVPIMRTRASGRPESMGVASPGVKLLPIVKDYETSC